MTQTHGLPTDVPEETATPAKLAVINVATAGILSTPTAAHVASCTLESRAGPHMRGEENTEQTI